MSLVTTREVVDELLRLSRLSEDALRAVRDRGHILASRERDYRLARALAWQSTEGTAKAREDAVNAATANERYARDVAQADCRSAEEAVRNFRQQISCWQTIANVQRAELQLARTGPEFAA